MTKAAVLTAVGAPLELHDGVEVEPPRAGEVQVRMVAAGVCHSDRSFQDGVLPVTLPAVLGHEGAAVVEEVGEGLTDFAPGDHVALSWVPQCASCYYCQRGQPQLCQQGDVVLVTAGLLDGNPRLQLDGAPLHQILAIGAFAERTVVPAISAVKVPADVDLEMVALISCGVLTGVGAALNTATIREGDTVAVLGCGGVGLNVVQGARLAGAAEIVAADRNPAALALARKLGATVVVDTSSADPVSAVRSLTAERGADVAFEVIGKAETIDQVLTMTRRGGQSVLVGIPPMDVMLSVPAFMGVVLQEKTIKGCWYGSSDVRSDIPRLLDLYRDGKLLLDPLVARRIGLGEVNQALGELDAGAVARSLVTF